MTKMESKYIFPNHNFQLVRATNQNFLFVADSDG